MTDYSRDQAIKSAHHGSLRTNAAIVADLARAGSLDEVAFGLTEFITRRPLVHFRAVAHPDSFVAQLHGESRNKMDAGFIHDLIAKATRPNSFRFRVIALLEDDYGDARATFRFLADQRGLDGVAYFDKLVTSVAALEARIDWFADPRTLFDGSFRAAIDKLLARGVRLKELSGLTNTVIGRIYEWAFQPPAVTLNGFADVIGAPYDVAYDLGGGFTTPYLAARFRQPLVCLDLFDPRTRNLEEHAVVAAEYRSVGLTFDPGGCPFQYFDVYESDYPTDHARYLITSFGFIGSTPGDVTGGRETPDEPSSFATIYAAARGIAKLVVAGKDVTLCVFGRPSSARFANVCYTLHFVAGKLATTRAITANCQVDAWLPKDLKQWTRANGYEHFSSS